jgi:Electron transfer DM13
MEVVGRRPDLARYASVVIWCDRFNSAFGAAPLR